MQVARDEQEAMKFVEGLRGFYGHLMSYVLVIGGCFRHQLPEQPGLYLAWWPMLGWGLGLASHAINLFPALQLFGPEWGDARSRNGWGAGSDPLIMKNGPALPGPFCFQLHFAGEGIALLSRRIIPLFRREPIYLA